MEEERERSITWKRNVEEFQVISKRMERNNINERKEIYIEQSAKTVVDKILGICAQLPCRDTAVRASSARLLKLQRALTIVLEQSHNTGFDQPYTQREPYSQS